MATGNTEWKSRLLRNTESSVTNHEPPIAVNEPVSVDEESPVTAMRPSITGNERTVSVDNGYSGRVEPSIDPTPDLSQSETPSNSGNRLATPEKWPVTRLRHSARLQRKKGNLARHLRWPQTTKVVFLFSFIWDTR